MFSSKVVLAVSHHDAISGRLLVRVQVIVLLAAFTLRVRAVWHTGDNIRIFCALHQLVDTEDVTDNTKLIGVIVLQEPFQIDVFPIHALGCSTTAIVEFRRDVCEAHAGE